jgi:hypothetical protein
LLRWLIAIQTARITSPSGLSILARVILGTRVPLVLAGALAVTIVGTVPPPVSEALWRVSPHEVSNMFARWDTFFYYSIATQGYDWDPALFTYQNVVFFPLYPLLMRWGGALLGGYPMVAGLIVSLCAFAAGLAVLYRLALLDVSEEQARRAVLLVAVFPYAVFFSAVYTESLFFLLSVGAFYAMRRRHLGWAALCGLLAGLTRPNGSWLAVPLACIALWPNDREDAHDAGAPSLLAALLAASAPLAGTAIFSLYLQVRFGDALAWVHGQTAWGLPLLGRWPAPDPIPIQSDLEVRSTEWVVYVGNVAAFAAAVAAIRPVTRQFGLAYGLWIAVNIFPPLAGHLFLSMGRFVSVLFPVFLWLAARIPAPRLWPVAGTLGAAQALFAVWFFLWRAVF